MQTFLEETLLDLKTTYPDISKLTLVFPSKRAGAFFQKYLLEHAEKTHFSPTLVSIEEFIEDISQLKIIDSTELLFKGYTAYRELSEVTNPEPFELYLTWAQTILNDFNEIDRHLVDPNAFFNYLSAVQDIEHWYVKSERTPMMENYLAFWKLLPALYDQLVSDLVQEGIGYQGMVYRKAVEDVEHYLSARTTPAVFIGFNALNKAEQRLIQSFLTDTQNQIYWDVDSYFYKDSQHTASLFVRSYVNTWPFFEGKSIALPPSAYTAPKKITTIAAQKNMTQVQMVGHLLASFDSNKIANTAIVLADERLLIPLLYALPSSVETVNVTMGVELRQFPLYNFFERLIYVHSTPKHSYYYKEVFQLINHSVSQLFLSHPNTIKQHITESNLTTISFDTLKELAHQDDLPWITLLFQLWESKATSKIDTIITFILKIKEKVSLRRMDRIVLYELFQVMTTIKGLSEHFNYLTDTKTLLQFFQELAANHSIDFEGDAYHGLQIMGLLETRCLDFENVIMLSVNEGTLPAGKSNASYITSDMKKAFDLPRYTEKDAVYTYHFYRLLQRANDVYLLYNAFADGLNSGEKSRFLLQLEIDGHPNHEFKKLVADPSMEVHELPLKTIEKTPEFMKRMAEVAQKGFSPSALTSYIRNPLDFYYQKVLQIKELIEVEETVAYNTLGTIVHNALETLYKPLIGKTLTASGLNAMKQSVPEIIQEQFDRTFRKENYQTGKNLIIYQVAQRYVENLIALDLGEIARGSQISIIAIEKELAIDWSMEELPFPVRLHGIVDRIDQKDGALRIIDYKTGRVSPYDLHISDWEALLEDYKYSKAFQVLLYATMLEKAQFDSTTVTAGIISFKSLQEGYMPFAKKEAGSRRKDSRITEEVLQEFGQVLSTLIQEICDLNVPIVEKEVP